MSVLDQAQALFRSGRQQEAVDLVARRAGEGDGEALYAMANWRLFALYGPRDVPAAHDLLARAAAAGHVDAIRTRAFLTANGTGCGADPEAALAMLRPIAARDEYAALQLHFVPQMMSEADALARPRERLSDAPLVEMVRGLLTPAECAYVMTLAEPELRPSTIVDPAGRRMPHPTRTSFGMSFGPTREDLVINALNRRLAAVAGTDPAWGEPLHILRYREGQEYKPHVDALPGVANQRGWTALVYLNEDYEGGETVFPELGVSARGRAGDTLLFRNLLDDGRGDPRARHAGRPVPSGAKWLATRWIRQAPYDPFTDA